MVDFTLLNVHAGQLRELLTLFGSAINRFVANEADAPQPPSPAARLAAPVSPAGVRARSQAASPQAALVPVAVAEEEDPWSFDPHIRRIAVPPSLSLTLCLATATTTFSVCLVGIGVRLFFIRFLVTGVVLMFGEL